MDDTPCWGQQLAGLPVVDAPCRSGVVDWDIVGRDQLLFLGDLAMPGARPGLISSGVAADFAVSPGRNCGVARSVVDAGIHPGRAGGLIRTSDSRVATSATVRSSQGRPWAPTAPSLIVTVAVKPETSGTPGGT